MWQKNSLLTEVMAAKEWSVDTKSNSFCCVCSSVWHEWQRLFVFACHLNPTTFLIFNYLFFLEFLAFISITPADVNPPCCVFCRWPSPHGWSSRASYWAASMRRPTWPGSSWSQGTTRTESTPSTCRRATGWAASEPSETPDTTGEQG